VPAQRVGGPGGVGVCAADEAAGGGGLGTGTLVDGSRRREGLGVYFDVEACGEGAAASAG
jgi:hypothetical protein